MLRLARFLYTYNHYRQGHLQPIPDKLSVLTQPWAKPSHLFKVTPGAFKP